MEKEERPEKDGEGGWSETQVKAEYSGGESIQTADGALALADQHRHAEGAVLPVRHPGFRGARWGGSF